MLRITLPGKGPRLALFGWQDMAAGEIVGWAMEDHMPAELCCDALNMALGRRGPVLGWFTILTGAANTLVKNTAS